MRVKQVNRYYCDFCRKHGLSRHAMAGHELKCTLNPERECRWGGKHVPDTKRWAGVMGSSPLTPEAVQWLRGETGGCPACMLAALRQSSLTDIHYGQGSAQRVFDYDAEVAEYRKAERAEPDDWL